MWKVSFDLDSGSENMTVKATNAMNAIREAVATKASMMGKIGDVRYVVLLLNSVYSVTML